MVNTRGQCPAPPPKVEFILFLGGVRKLGSIDIEKHIDGDSLTKWSKRKCKR